MRKKASSLTVGNPTEALRHNQRPARASQVVFDGVVVDFENVEVTRNGTSVVLTDHELNTLQLLVQNPDRVITRAELLKEVCGYEDGITTRTIDNVSATMGTKKTRSTVSRLRLGSSNMPTPC